MAEPGFWEASVPAQMQLDANNKLMQKHDRFTALAKALVHLAAGLELYLHEPDPDLQHVLQTCLMHLQEKLAQ